MSFLVGHFTSSMIIGIRGGANADAEQNLYGTELYRLMSITVLDFLAVLLHLFLSSKYPLTGSLSLYSELFYLLNYRLFVNPSGSNISHAFLKLLSL